MNFFNTFITAFCTGCLLIGALHLLCPDGAMQKPVKYVLSLVFMLTVIAAASITVKNAKFDTGAFTPTETAGEELDTAAAEYVYAHALESAGINFSKITVCTDKSEDGSIIISKVIVYSDCEKWKITEALGVVAENYEVEVINE